MMRKACLYCKRTDALIEIDPIERPGQWMCDDGTACEIRQTERAIAGLNEQIEQFTGAIEAWRRLAEDKRQRLDFLRTGAAHRR